MSGHTPGPWKFGEDFSEEIVDAHNNPVALCALGVASIPAAEKSLALLERGAPGWGVSKDLLRAAIAKATTSLGGPPQGDSSP